MTKFAIATTILTLFLFLESPRLLGQTVTLLTAEQAQKAQADETATKAEHANLPVPAPQVKVLEPSGGQVSGSPFPVRVEFSTTGGATVDLDKIAVDVVGPLGITYPLTNLVRPYLTQKGIDLPNAKIPKGKYDVRINLRDSNGRAGGVEQIWTIH